MMTADGEIAFVLQTIDALALALSSAGHQWTECERLSYDTTVSLLTFGDYTETEAMPHVSRLLN